MKEFREMFPRDFIIFCILITIGIGITALVVEFVFHLPD